MSILSRLIAKTRTPFLICISLLCLEASHLSSGYSYAANGSYQPLLIGLIVHSEEVATLDALQDGPRHLIKLTELMPKIQSSVSVQGSVIRIISPSGETTLPTSDAESIHDEWWLDVESLNSRLYLNAKFDQSKFALVIMPPWINNPALPSRKEQLIDVRPNLFSMNQMRLELEFDQQPGNEVTQRRELITNGAALGGSWRAAFVQQQSDEIVPEEVFWLKQTPHSQLLIGQQIVAPSTILPPTELTGVQYLSSNKEIEFSANTDITNRSFAEELGDSIQNFSGTGPAGTLARLYIDGNLVRQEYVGIGGQFDFGEVQLPSHIYNQVEVIFIDPLERTIVEERNLSQARKNSLLDKGQQVLNFAVGESGNIFDPDHEDLGFAGMTSIRYGISDTTTLEATLSQVEEESNTPTPTIGITQSIAKNYVASLLHAQQNNKDITQLELEGTGNKWRLHSRFRQEKANDDEQKDTNLGALHYQYTPTPSVNLSLDGRYDDQPKGETYLLPGIQYHASKSLTVSTRPNTKGHYRTQLEYQPNNTLRLKLRTERQRETARLDWRLNAYSNAYYSYQRNELDDEEQGDGRSIENAIGLYLRPGDWQSANFLRAEISQDEENKRQYELEISKHLFSGINLDLRVKESEQGSNPGTSVFGRLTFNFSHDGNKLVPTQVGSSHNTYGTITGSLLVDDEQCEIDEVNVLVGSSSIRSPVTGCQFHLGRILPGIYPVSLDAEGLPIEYVPLQKRLWVEVGRSAVSTVKLAVQKEYGVAGKITSSDGTNKTDVQLVLFNENGELLGYTAVDQFGYYRIDQLTSGKYELLVKNAKGHTYVNSLTFEITNDFLFDQNIVVDDARLFSIKLDFLTEPIY